MYNLMILMFHHTTKFKNKSKIIWNMCLYVVYLYRNQKQNIMIKSVEEKTSRLEIDLTGSEGNAFVLLGYASRLSKQLGLDHQKVQSEMTSGDYENLVDTFDKYFGEYVTLYR